MEFNEESLEKRKWNGKKKEEKGNGEKALKKKQRKIKLKFG